MLLLLRQHSNEQNFTVCILSRLLFVVEVFPEFFIIIFLVLKSVFEQPNDALTVTCSLKLSAKAVFMKEVRLIVFVGKSSVVIRSKCAFWWRSSLHWWGQVEVQSHLIHANWSSDFSAFSFRAECFHLSAEEISTHFCRHTQLLCLCFAPTSPLPFAA